MPLSESQNSFPLRRLQTGVNLIELLIVLVIAGVLLGVALPAGQGMLERGQLRAATNDVYSALLFARNEAIRLRQSTSLCMSSNSTPAACSAGAQPYLGIFTQSTGYELSPGKASNPVHLGNGHARARLVNAGGNRLVFQALGNRTVADDSDDPVYIEVTLSNLTPKHVEICFNGRVFIRETPGVSRCEG